MFPQVAPKFFKTRHDGPKNLGKDPTTAARAAEPTPSAQTANTAKSLAATANYAITLNGKEHMVTVAAKK